MHVRVGVAAMLLLATGVLSAPATSPATRPGALGPGQHKQQLDVGGRTRFFLVHVPPKYDPSKPAPVVLVFHGAMMNGQWAADYTQMGAKADAEGFIAVFPSGTGPTDIEAGLTWNAWDMPARAAGREAPDDVAFTAALLDELAARVNVDPRRVFATGISNGGMMCYRLALEMPDRIAAIAPVAGTPALAKYDPKRPVPVIHFHGTQDRLVRYEGPDARAARFFSFKSVDATMKLFAKLHKLPEEPKVEELPDKVNDGTTVKRYTWGPGKAPPVVLVKIEQGGHTWPGTSRLIPWLGNTTRDISANDLMWEFFLKHPKE